MELTGETLQARLALYMLTRILQVTPVKCTQLGLTLRASTSLPAPWTAPLVCLELRERPQTPTDIRCSALAHLWTV